MSRIKFAHTSTSRSCERIETTERKTALNLMTERWQLEMAARTGKVEATRPQATYLNFTLRHARVVLTVNKFDPDDNRGSPSCNREYLRQVQSVLC